jgi:cardiolipin synthase
MDPARPASEDPVIVAPAGTHRLARPARVEYVLHIPNLISLGRVLLAPVVIWLIINNRPMLAFVAFAIAGASDAVDGYVAKRFNWQSDLGALLDPLADKLLLVSIYVALGLSRELPSWLVIAVVMRDLLIIVGVLLAWLLGKPMKVKPYKISKVNTACQIVLAAVVLADKAFNLEIDTLRLLLVIITGALIAISLGTYLVAWLRHLAGYETGFRQTPE